MNKHIATYLLFIALLFTSCERHTHGCGNTPATDARCELVADARYKSVALLERLAAELDSSAAGNVEMNMVASNARAYSALMQMDYSNATELYSSVIDASECEIEKLVADVGLMTISYRVSANRLFFDYRARALERIKRINEEVDYLCGSDRNRYERAKTEFAIVSICYFSNLSMQEELQRAFHYLRNEADATTNPALKSYAGMLIANSVGSAEERLNQLSQGLWRAERNGYTWLCANYRLLLAIILRDNSNLLDKLPAILARRQAQCAAPTDLPYQLSLEAAEDFRRYGDKYMMIEALAVSASCLTQLGEYDAALDRLDMALRGINSYYAGYYPDSLDYAANNLVQYEFDIAPYMATTDEMYNIPECLLSVRREASCAFAGLGDIEASAINRDSYLLLLRTTRLNKFAESSASTFEADAARLGIWLVVLLLGILLLAVAIIVYNGRRRRYISAYSGELRRLPDVCRQLLSSLSQDAADKEELFANIANCLNGCFAGNIHFCFSAAGQQPPYGYMGFPLKYIGGGAPDVLCVKSEQPFTPAKLFLLEMLLPYVAVAVEEGMRLANISDEQERLEELRSAYALYLTEQKRENLLKRVSMSVVSSMRPFMDRMANELRALRAVCASQDAERKLLYVAELTKSLDDLNVILERWIRMRHGDMNLQVESFAVKELFAIIEKSRQLMESRGISLSVPTTEAVVKADKVLTLFMINTLIDNAAKFTPKGGSISLECVESTNYVEIAVADTGIGISKADIDRILNSKVYDAATIGGDNALLQPQNKGGGFGLMNCKGIIEKYKKTDPLFSVCSMDIKGEKGRGSRFSFRLPKGMLRLVLLLLMMLPGVSSANGAAPEYRADSSAALFYEVRLCADSLYNGNACGNYDQAFAQGNRALSLLNDYYRATVGGNDTLSLAGGQYAELLWWRNNLFADHLTEDIFYNILDLRNELAVASLALQEWQHYRYNNYIYSTLYRLVHEDKGIALRYEQARDMLALRRALLAIFCFILLSMLLYFIVVYLRHSVVGKANERAVADINLKLLELVAASPQGCTQQLLQSVVDEIHTLMGERMCITRVAIVLRAAQRGVFATSPVAAPGERADVYLHGVLDDGAPYISSSSLLRALPLFAVVQGKEVLVGAIEIVTERPLSDNEAVSLELVARFVATALYHSQVRVAGRYTALEEINEETERIKLEENRLHVQNMVMDNCLSLIKHETVYYPSRVRELALKAQASIVERGSNIAQMGELVDYYSSIFGILSNQAKRELDTMCFSLMAVRLDTLFEAATRYLSRRAAKQGVALSLSFEPTDATVSVDSDFATYLFEVLLDAALAIGKEGALQLRATDGGEFVKVELVDSRMHLTANEAALLFTPSGNNIAGDGTLRSMEYLIAKEIVRMHEEYTGRHGSRVEARSDVAATVIMFTLPK